MPTFYREVMQTPATVTQKQRKGALAEVRMGQGQVLRFCETTKALPDYDGHHIAVYVADSPGRISSETT